MDYVMPRPLDWMPLYQGMLELAQTSRLICDGTELFRCPRLTDVSTKGCYSYWPILPSEDPNPFFPMPTALQWSEEWNVRPPCPSSPIFLCSVP